MQNEIQNQIKTVKHYNILQQITAGAFGTLFLGENKRTGEKVAIKVEKTDTGFIKHETQMLQYLYEKGVRSIPAVYWYGMCSGISEKYPVLVIPHYTCNLAQYIQHKYLSVENLRVLMCKLIGIFQDIHGGFVVHRDIKPQNFMVKGANLYLIDFGLSTFFIDESGDHVPDKLSDHIVGTPRFASINIHRGHRYSRRDDLISLGYLGVWLMKRGQCPWEPTQKEILDAVTLVNLHADKVSIRYERNVALLKNKEFPVFLQKCLMGSDHPISHYLEYVYGLDYSCMPDYDLLKRFFGLFL